MTCDRFDARLDDWLDGTLPATDAGDLEAHLAGCDACREKAARLRELMAHAAALPRSLAPPRDLWPGVEARIARPVGWAWLVAGVKPAALAAAVIVVIGVIAAVWRNEAPGTVRTVAIPVERPEGVEPASTIAGAAWEDPVLAQAEREYEAAASALLDALQQRSRALSPETLARVQDNLQVIDRALSEVRGALARDPRNPELSRMLVATHRKKVDVLQRVVRLSTAL